MMRCVETILAAVERLAAAKLEIDDAHRSAGVRVSPGPSLASIFNTAVFSSAPRPGGSRPSKGASVVSPDCERDRLRPR
jgi:hypothetical protein